MKNTTPATQGSPAGQSRAQHHHWPCNTTQSSDSSAASDISSFLPTSRLQGPDPSLLSHSLRTLTKTENSQGFRICLWTPLINS